MPFDRFGTCCCQPASGIPTLDIMILFENNRAMNLDNDYWGGQSLKTERYYIPGTSPFSIGLITIPGTPGRWETRQIPDFRFTKVEVAHDLIDGILRNVKKTNLILKDKIKIWILVGSTWTEAYLCPSTINENINSTPENRKFKANSFSIMHWPMYKSPRVRKVIQNQVFNNFAGGTQDLNFSLINSSLFGRSVNLEEVVDITITGIISSAAIPWNITNEEPSSDILVQLNQYIKGWFTSTKPIGFNQSQFDPNFENGISTLFNLGIGITKNGIFEEASIIFGGKINSSKHADFVGAGAFNITLNGMRDLFISGINNALISHSTTQPTLFGSIGIDYRILPKGIDELYGNEEYASDSDRNDSFSAVLSEGYGNGPYTTISSMFTGFPKERMLDQSLSFVKGLNFSSIPPGFNWSPIDLERGSYFTIFGNNGKAGGFKDYCKIYHSSTSGYLVDTKDYFNNGYSWPAGYGTVEELDLPFFTGSQEYPAYPVYQYEYYPRIPESQKNNIQFRDIRVGLGVFCDYNNKYSQWDPTYEVCVPYERTYGNLVEESFPLCFPNCQTDNIFECEDLIGYLRAARAKVLPQDLNSFKGVTRMIIDENQAGEGKGLYITRPAIQVLPSTGKGVGAIAVQMDLESYGFEGQLGNIVRTKNNPTILSQGFGYESPPKVSFQNSLTPNLIFSEDFTTLTSGQNTANGIDNVPWKKWNGNFNFPYTRNAYEANGAVMLSGSEAFIATRPNLLLNFPFGGTFTVETDIKGWTDIEGFLEIKVSGTVGNPNSVYYDNDITKDFVTYYSTFESTTGTSIIFSPQINPNIPNEFSENARLFINKIRIQIPSTTPFASAYERGWILKCDFTRNFDHIYAAKPFLRTARNATLEHGIGSAQFDVVSNGTPPIYTTQALSAIKNAALKFDVNSKKMIILVANGFMAHNEPLNPYTSTRGGNPLYPYPRKEDIKNILNEKNIILHAITFGPSFMVAGNTFNQEDEYAGIAPALKAFAPRTGASREPGNTLNGYVSTIEEITSLEGLYPLTGVATGSKLWILSSGTLVYNDGPHRTMIDRSSTNIGNGIAYTKEGGRIIPSGLRYGFQDIRNGIFSSILENSLPNSFEFTPL